MGKQRQAAVNDIFDALLSGLPQGVLLGVVWLVYSVWTTLTYRRWIP